MKNFKRMYSGIEQEACIVENNDGTYTVITPMHMEQCRKNYKTMRGAVNWLSGFGWEEVEEEFEMAAKWNMAEMEAALDGGRVVELHEDFAIVDGIRVEFSAKRCAALADRRSNWSNLIVVSEEEMLEDEQEPMPDEQAAVAVITNEHVAALKALCERYDKKVDALYEEQNDALAKSYADMIRGIQRACIILGIEDEVGYW